MKVIAGRCKYSRSQYCLELEILAQVYAEASRLFGLRKHANENVFIIVTSFDGPLNYVDKANRV